MKGRTHCGQRRLRARCITRISLLVQSESPRHFRGVLARPLLGQCPRLLGCWMCRFGGREHVERCVDDERLVCLNFRRRRHNACHDALLRGWKDSHGPSSRVVAFEHGVRKRWTARRADAADGVLIPKHGGHSLWRWPAGSSRLSSRSEQSNAPHRAQYGEGSTGFGQCVGFPAARLQRRVNLAVDS